ncbi:MAG: hypothetical protein NC350_05060 [Corallococcus sp.]|nr:hypothetical protein [Corallococcus sp.]
MAKKIVISVLVLILLAAIAFGIWFCYVFTNGFTTDFKTFYLQVDTVNGIVTADRDVPLTKTRIDVKALTGSSKFTYYAENCGDDFEFTVDGEKHTYLTEDFTEQLNVTSDEKGITVDCKRFTTLELLQTKYKGCNVEITENVKARIKLTVVSEDGSRAISLTFVTKDMGSITLVPDGIVF